jgi:hypothetical protein
MEPSTLRSVPSSGSADGGEKQRREARARPAQPLPTDRIKLDVQLRVIQAIGRMSTDRKPIPNDRLSAALDNEVSRHSVALSHRFFVECGWLERVGRGEYAASAALVGFARRLGVAPQERDAAFSLLRAAVKTANGWFWPVITRQIEHGRAPISEVMVALMTEAEVGEDHRPQVRMLLDWLKLVGLIGMDADTVSLTETSMAGTEPAEPIAAEPTEPSSPTPARAEVQEPMRPQPANGGPVVLSFDFSFRLTLDDLSRLTPEQIRATYEAVGALMAIQHG